MSTAMASLFFPLLSPSTSHLSLHLPIFSPSLPSLHSSSHHISFSKTRRHVSSVRPLSFPGGGFDPFGAGDDDDGKWEPSKYEALLKGGEQVTSVLQEMIKLLEDMDMDEASEAAAVEIAAQGVIGKRVDEMESGFMMALDYMIQTAEKENDDQVTDENA